MSYISVFLGLLPVVVSIMKGVFDREDKQPEPGHGAEKKKSLLEEVMTMITNSNFFGTILGNNASPTAKFADGFINLFVQWQKDMNVFKGGHDIDTDPVEKGGLD